MARNHGRRIEDDRPYQALRKQGASKEKAACIAKPGRREAGKRSGKSAADGDWNKDDPYQRAKEFGIEGRSGMNNCGLIDALRNP